MGLLQDPIAALDQVDWYLANRKHEKFPGAFELAAGNLCRQAVEQVLLMLCFFSGMPQHRYIKSRDRSLKVAGELLKQLGRTNDSGIRYWELARRRGPRIRKFASQPRTLDKWRKDLNEPSHFSTRWRVVDAATLAEFTGVARGWFDKKDKFLLVGIVNHLFSKGRFTVTLSGDADNTPGISQRVVVTASNLQRGPDNQIALRTPHRPIHVISSTDVPRGPWPRQPVIVQGSVGIGLQVQLVTRRGNPVDISSLDGILRSFGSTSGERSYLSRRLRQLGFRVSLTKKVVDH